MIAKGTITLLTCTSEDLGIFILHRGILLNNGEYVLHRAFKGVQLTHVNRFLRKRKILATKTYNLKKPVDIDKILARYKNDKFDLITNNCENFVNDFINTYTTSNRFHASQSVAVYAIILTKLLL